MKKIIALCLTMFFAGSAYAAESAGNRKDSILQIGYAPVGIHFATLVAPTTSVAAYLGESLIIGVEAGSQDYSWEDGDDTVDMNYSQQGVFARWFPGNSFNVLGAYHQRDFSADATVSETAYGMTATATGSLDANATVATVGIGNQWQFDFGLVIGADWVVASTLLSSSVTASVSESTGYADTSEAEQSLADLGETVNEASGAPGVLIVYVAFAF